ncbi:MAG TPA: MarR family transcriptional regulator [Clostridiales bacterium]|nr:MarR family transcriptional regulator [Clostridiales bacterium]
MAAQIVKTYTQKLPATRFIGKKFTDKDRIGGNFGKYWGDAFAGDWFGTIENVAGGADKCAELYEDGGAYIGLMRAGFYPVSFEMLCESTGIEDTKLGEMLRRLIEDGIVEYFTSDDQTVRGYRFTVTRGIAAYMILALNYLLAEKVFSKSEYLLN